MSTGPTALEPVTIEITQALIDLYCDLTDDYNPIHTDPAFAAATAMGGIIAHGTLSLNLIWDSIARTLGPGYVEGAALAVRFVAPARLGDRITAGGEALPDGRSFRVWTMNQDGKTTIAGELTKP